jgi:hypothetical protein
MQAIRRDSVSARTIAAAIATPFTLLDVGCSGGIDGGWDLFGDGLRAFGFDPSLHEIERLAAAEQRPGVRYVNGFVGLPAGHPARGASIDPWRLDPWGRLSAYRTQQLQQARAAAEAKAQASSQPPPAAAAQDDLMARNLWREADLADPARPIVLPQFLDEQGVRDVDFIKLDVDGTDFEILQSLDGRLDHPPVLGAVLEVNFFGGPDPHVNSFHNIDRFMRAQGFDLFDLTVRGYSLATLPRPFLYPHPLASQTTAGRPFQGDALYLRDVGYPFAGRDLSGWSDDKLLKLATLFAMTGLLDHAAEVLILFRERLAERLDIDATLDLMTRETQDGDADLWTGRRFPGYRDYIAAYEADDPAFYGAEPRRHAARQANDSPAEDHAALLAQAAWREEQLAERDAALVEARKTLDQTVHRLHQAEQTLLELKQSLAWKLIAPLRGRKDRG